MKPREPRQGKSLFGKKGRIEFRPATAAERKKQRVGNTQCVSRPALFFSRTGTFDITQMGSDGNEKSKFLDSLLSVG
jgi:hypothetical protein